jgi:hypothetical protein
VSGITIDFYPGDTYDDEPISGGPQETEEERARRRAERRLAAIESFMKSAQAATLKQMEPLVAQLCAMCIQLRALGGSGSETSMGSKLREAADFLEDL